MRLQSTRSISSLTNEREGRRYEAHKRLKSETIPGRIINVPPSAIRMYLGASAPF